MSFRQTDNVQYPENREGGQHLGQSFPVRAIQLREASENEGERHVLDHVAVNPGCDQEWIVRVAIGLRNALGLLAVLGNALLALESVLLDAGFDDIERQQR